jgi:hypothetical protein
MEPEVRNNYYWWRLIELKQRLFKKDQDDRGTIHPSCPRCEGSDIHLDAQDYYLCRDCSQIYWIDQAGEILLEGIDF